MEKHSCRKCEKPGTPFVSIIDQAQLESELYVYPWTGNNNCIQMFMRDKLAVGRGLPQSKSEGENVHH
jgi:hypothetical protein